MSEEFMLEDGEVYLAPDPELSQSEVDALMYTCDAIEPISDYQFREFCQVTGGLRMNTLAIGLMHNTVRLKSSLSTLNTLLLEAAEEEAGEGMAEEIIQTAETIRALQSIQEQVILACRSIFKIELEIYKRDDLVDLLVEKSAEIVARNREEDDSDLQLELFE